jgi:hypothetical protein
LWPFRTRAKYPKRLAAQSFPNGFTGYKEKESMIKKQLIQVLYVISILVHTALIAEEFSAEAVFTQICSECHRSDASGNTDLKVPALNDLYADEIEAALEDIEEGMPGHMSMKKNIDKLNKMGKNFSKKEMGEYIFNNFYKK